MRNCYKTKHCCVLWCGRSGGTFGSSRTTLIAFGAGHSNYFPNLETLALGSHKALGSSFYQQAGETAKWKMSPPRAPGENPFPITIQLPRVWKEAPLQSAARWSWASVLPGPSVRSRGRCSRAFASALPFALGKREVGEGRVRHTPLGKFRPGSLEK